VQGEVRRVQHISMRMIYEVMREVGLERKRSDEERNEQRRREIRERVIYYDIRLACLSPFRPPFLLLMYTRS